MFAALLRKTATPETAAIVMDAHGIAVARIRCSPGKRPVLLTGDYQPCAAENAARSEGLHALVQKHHLQKTTCVLVLEEGDYKFLLTEAPPVPKEEVAAALRWRVKELINAPAIDITLDTLDAPNAAGTQQAMIYVVAARNESLRTLISPIKAAKFNLNVIDIAETAQRNIAAVLQDKTALAALSVRPHYSLLTVTRGRELYLSRTLVGGLTSIFNEQLQEDAFNQLALEVQRSLDYYESHYRQAPIRQLALLPLPENSEKFVSFMERNLSVEVKPVDLEQLADHDFALTKALQANIFLAFGAALRECSA